MNKRIGIFLIIIVIIFILMFFLNLAYKSIKTGNNINKSADDLIEYILNISSYEAKLEITINSNKTTNRYLLEQYYMEPTYSKQIIKEPSNLENLEIIYNGKNLEIRNTNLGLSKIYENYTYLNDNVLWLSYFIDTCNNSRYEVEENSEEIIVSCNMEKYNYKGKLYFDRLTVLPTKIEIKDNNNQNKIYIEYKEIKLNNIQNDNIFAYVTKDIKTQV